MLLFSLFNLFNLLIGLNVVTAQTLECNSICKQFSRHDPNFDTFTAEEIAQKLESGECKALPQRSFGAPPIGSTMIFGYRTCISMPSIATINFEGTMCFYLYGWVYPENELYLHYSLIFDPNGSEAEDESLCSDSQTSLATFGTIDESGRTPLEVCPTLNNNKLCDNNGKNWDCIWTENDKTCKWKDDDSNVIDNNNNNNNNGMIPTDNGPNNVEANIDFNLGIDLSTLGDIVLYTGRFPNPGQKLIKINSMECTLKMYLKLNTNNFIDTKKYFDFATNTEVDDKENSINNDNNKLIEKSWIPLFGFGQFGFGASSSIKYEIDNLVHALNNDQSIKYFGGFKLNFQTEQEIVKSLTSIIGKKEAKLPLKYDVLVEQLKTAHMTGMYKIANYGYNYHKFILSNSHCIVTFYNQNGDKQPVYFSNFYESFNEIGLGTFNVNIPNINNMKNQGLTSIVLKLTQQTHSSSIDSNTCKLFMGQTLILSTNSTMTNVETDAIDLTQKSNSIIKIIEEISDNDQYLGCFVVYKEDIYKLIDINKDRANHLYYSDNKINSSPDLCQEACHQFKYFILNYGICYCSDKTPKYNAVDNKYCNSLQTVSKQDILNNQFEYPLDLWSHNPCSTDPNCINIEIIAIKIYKNSFYFGRYQLPTNIFKNDKISAISCSDYCTNYEDGKYKYYTLYNGNKCGCLIEIPSINNKVNNTYNSIKCHQSDLYLTEYKECGGKSTSNADYGDVYVALIGYHETTHNDLKYKPILSKTEQNIYGGKSDIYVKIDGVSTNKIDPNIDYPLYFFNGYEIPTFNHIKSNINSQYEKTYIERRRELYFKGKYFQINNKAFMINYINVFTLNINKLSLSDNMWYCLTCDIDGGAKPSLGYAQKLYIMLPSAMTEIYITSIAGDQTIKNKEANSFENIQTSILNSYQSITNNEELGLLYKTSQDSLTSLSSNKCYGFGKKEELIPDISIPLKLPMFGPKDEVRKAQKKETGNDKLSASIKISNIRISPTNVISSSSLMLSESSLSSTDSSFTVSYIPKLTIEYKLFEINNNPTFIPMDLMFPLLSHEIPSKPCNSIYKPPSNGNNRVSCCGYDGPSFCICDKIQCIEKCKNYGGIRKYQCDDSNTETTIPNCKCNLSSNTKKVLIIMIIIIPCFLFLSCVGLIIYVIYNKSNNNKDIEDKIEKAVYDKEFEDDPEADIPMLPNENDIIDYPDNDQLPSIPDDYFNQKDEEINQEDEFW